MEDFNVSIQPTSNPNIVKFETNIILTKYRSYEFQNIDDAKDSPLAQQLFYLPFVKTVYLSGNFVAIECFNIVEWKDVQDDVAQQIQTFLNDGGVVVKDANETSKIPVTVYSESTPNPSVLKFVTNKRLVPSSFEFLNIDEAKISPLATELFHFPFVKGVFLDENYVSITKFDMADWNEITLELREFIKSFIENGNDTIAKNVTSKLNTSIDDLDIKYEELDDTSKQIINIIEEYVKPAVASDGGNIQFESYDPNSKLIKVILQGACSGCPSSTFTLKNGIENMLKQMLNDNSLIVEAING